VLQLWKDIGYLCVMEANSHYADFTVYQVVGSSGPCETEVSEFHRAGYKSSDDLVERVEEAQIYLHGSVKWDGCADIAFDEQENVMLHFCGQTDATNIGVLLGRIYELAARMIPAWDKALAQR
jgi:hypothetical protein